MIAGAVEQTRQLQVEQAEAEYRENFKPHAVILTERSRPEPIFVAALIGVDTLLRVDFELDGDHQSYISKALEGVERRLARWHGSLPAFGKATGLIVNYSPNFAVRFDLRGTPQEMFGAAYRIGQADLLLKGSRIPFALHIT